MGKLSEAQLRAVKKYQEAHTVVVPWRFNHRTDADIIKRLGEIEGSKSGYIKGLIRADIERGKKE